MRRDRRRRSSLPHVCQGAASTTSISSASRRKRLRHRVRRALAGDALHPVLILGDVLQVHGRDDADAVGQQLFQRPASAPGCVSRAGCGRPVRRRGRSADGGERWRARRGRHSRGRRGVPGGWESRSRAASSVVDLRAVAGLGGGHHHILAAHASAPAFVEHAVRLAHARRIAQKHLEPAAAGAAAPRPARAAAVLPGWAAILPSALFPPRPPYYAHGGACLLRSSALPARSARK